MSKARENPIDDAFFALSHPVRRQILEQLANDDMSVSEVSAPVDATPSQMTKHLHILERAGMLSRHKSGRVHRLRMQPEPLREIMDWVSRHQKFWNDQLDGLERYLNTIEGGNS